ncbi:hypothetical protein CTI12_AA405570 [Artemisia annua]|uniref:Uncharacterized protein n=1 Tax=Artemisia annua TaxID=35608 RepID=A0A2U1MA68_ARTAN|nr:hypothetical protein CTI12_AA405570 [Artemisia annua]
MQRQRHSLRLSNANKSKIADNFLQGFKQPQETASQGKQPQETTAHGKKILKKILQVPKNKTHKLSPSILKVIHQ